MVTSLDKPIEYLMAIEIENAHLENKVSFWGLPLNMVEGVLKIAMLEPIDGGLLYIYERKRLTTKVL